MCTHSSLEPGNMSHYEAKGTLKMFREIIMDCLGSSDVTQEPRKAENFLQLVRGMRGEQGEIRETLKRIRTPRVFTGFKDKGAGASVIHLQGT